MAEFAGFALYFSGAIICVFFAKLFLTSVSRSKDARRSLRHNAGINIVHGGRGNQSGELAPDKRVSRGLFD